MSHKALDMAFDVTDIVDPKEHLAFLYLANCANKDTGNAFPSVNTLAEWVHCSERTMRYILRRLEKSGKIAPIANRKGGRMSTIYQLSFPGWIVAQHGTRAQKKATFRVIRTSPAREQVPTFEIDELPDFEEIAR